jgi:phage/plasmid-like protein (TIGR03299 family)
MPAQFDTGFFVREPAWHGQGVVLDDFPGREIAMELAGHDFTVDEYEAQVVTKTSVIPATGFKALVKSGTEQVLNVVKDSYTVIQNDTAWDVVDAIIGAGARYETGITLKDGAVCVVTAWLDEPVRITGDDSEILPYLVTRWTHDGSGSLSARSTSVRVVCANTDEAAAAQGKRLGTEFTFRHTKNVHDRIEDAKLAVQGLRLQHEEFIAISEELARTPVTAAQRELFISELLPVPPAALVSERVLANVDGARALVRNLFDGPTIPEAHRFTAYGLRLAGVEYLDHLRGYRNADTYVGRQLLRTEPAKVKLASLIREVVKA